MDPGFFRYAILDAIATWRVHAALRPRAVECARGFQVRDETIRRWGVLTEYIQIRGALALSRMSRNGMRLDLGRAKSVQQTIRARIFEHADRLRSHP